LNISKSILILFSIILHCTSFGQDLKKIKEIKRQSDIVVEGMPFDYHVVLNADSSQAYHYSYFKINDVFSSKLNEDFDTVAILNIVPFYQIARTILEEGNYEFADKYVLDKSIPPLPIKPMQKPRHNVNRLLFMVNNVPSVVFAEHTNKQHKGYPVYKLNNLFTIDISSEEILIGDCFGFLFNDLEVFYSFLDKKLKLDIPDNRFSHKKTKQ
jgi:hypothetical protein